MKKRKQMLTLLEIMIVIFIIGLIGSVMGYNMKGSLAKGKAFKSEEGIRKLYEIYQLAMAEGKDVTQIKASPGDILKETGLIRNPGKLLKDGWGKDYDIEASDDETDIRITSERLTAYYEKEGKSLTYPWDDE